MSRFGSVEGTVVSHLHHIEHWPKRYLHYGKQNKKWNIHLNRPTMGKPTITTRMYQSRRIRQSKAHFSRQQKVVLYTLFSLQSTQTGFHEPSPKTDISSDQPTVERKLSNTLLQCRDIIAIRLTTLSFPHSSSIEEKNSISATHASDTRACQCVNELEHAALKKDA